MKKILKKLDKLVLLMKQNRVDILNELMRIARGGEIVLTVVYPWGQREKLKIAPRGVCQWNSNKYKWNEWIDIDFSRKDQEKSIRKLSNSIGGAGYILLRILAGEVDIEIT